MIKVLTTAPELRAIESEWDELAAADPSATPYQTAALTLGLWGPGSHFESPRFTRVEFCRRGILQPLQFRTDLRLQVFEPGLGTITAGFDLGRYIGHERTALGIWPVWRNASERPMAAETVTLKDRRPGLRGIITRASAAS